LSGNRVAFAVTLAASAFGILASSSVAFAQSSRPYETSFAGVPVGPNDWILTVKGNAQITPMFEGSDKTSFVVFPSFTLRRATEPRRFAAPDDGVSLTFYGNPVVSFGVVAAYQGGRYYQDDRRLFGLSKINWTIEPGVFVELWPTEQLRGRFEIRHGLNGSGFTAGLALDWVERVGRFTVSGGPRAVLADSDYMDKYYSVSPYEAAINGRVLPFKAKGGVRSVGAAAAISYDWSDEWNTTLFGRYDYLTGDAGKSPIVRAFGSRNQFSVGLPAAYSFKTTW